MNSRNHASPSEPQAPACGQSERGAEVEDRAQLGPKSRSIGATRFGNTGTLRAIAHRPTDGQPMIEARQVNVIAGRGIDTENRKPGTREITLVSTKSWSDACRDLGKEVPWYFRRANLLIEGIDLPATIGKKIKIGPVELLIHGETRPCGIMDQQQAGLKDALKPEMRGGVHAQVLRGGTLRVGDQVEVF